ncbi:MAG: hypothetical protein IKA72_01245 [Clostridia bacterium]|nr:hypothetical protein [Clostridia bacterium]
MAKKFMDTAKDLLKNKKFVAGVSIGLAVAIATPIVISLFNNDGPTEPVDTGFNNETSTLVFSSGEFDRVFNPFFSTSAYDSGVVGQTQISMISSDENGKEVVFGKDEPVVTLDYSEIMYDQSGNVTKTGDENGTTVYQMVLKDGILFSDGQPLTAHDVLFNMYVYLDPAYTGSSTMYSTDIVGLANYQTQKEGEISAGAQAALERTFSVLSGLRLSTIVAYVDGLASTNWETALAEYNFQCSLEDNGIPTVQRKDEDGNPVDYAETDILKDIEKIKKEWINEITMDWNAASSDLASMQEEYPFTKPWQLYFYNEGLIARKTEVNPVNGGTTYPKDANGKYIIEWDLYGYDPNAEYTKEQAIDEVKTAYLTDDTFVADILGGWATSGTISQLFAAEDKQLYYEARRAEDGELKIKSIEGIKIKSASEFKGTKKYPTDDYSKLDMLEITINGVDPKAKWNFAFAVAPMHYYSTPELSAAALADDTFTSNFGVSYSSVDFMNALKRRNDVPMGAGIYKASTMYDYVYDWNNGNDSASFEKLSNEFCDSNVCYFIRNDNFVTTGGNTNAVYNAKIKHIQYKVVNSANTMTSLQGGSIHYADPSATTENISIIDNHPDLKRIMQQTAGYGYIGINAKFVKNINVRRALMSAMDISLVQNYYPGNLSEPIYRSFSKTSWVNDAFEEDGVEILEKWSPVSRDSDGESYVEPEENEQYYKYHKNADKATEKDLVKAQVKKYLDLGGCQFRSGKWYDSDEFGGELLKFTFTVAGDTTDHPAYKTFLNARDILNEMGLEIEVIPDSRALFKLASGNLAIWAAAWSSSLDPDMYQVYHKDSKATSILNWGYDYIKKSGTSEEMDLIDRISAEIDAGRETIDAAERAEIYRYASDLVMELAVELPVYQRSDMNVYNSKVLDANTFKKNITPFAGPLSEMWKVSFIEG